MDKEIIVKLLQKDISELAQLTQGFDEMDVLPAVLLQLARQKAATIVENLQLLSKTETAAQTPPAGMSAKTIVPDNRAEKPMPVSAPAETPANMPPPPEAPAVAKAEPEKRQVVAASTYPEIPVTEKTETEAGKTAAIAEPEESQHPAPTENDEKTAGEETRQATETVVPETKAAKPKEQPEKSFLHREVITRNDSLQQKVDDVKQTISIGDHFLFQRELFGGNGELMSKTITVINACKDLESAEQYLKKKFKWDPENPATERFMQVVRRKF